MFYSSFIVGFEELVKKIIEDKYPNISIKQILNGALICNTLDSNIKLPFLNNLFSVYKYERETNIIKFINSLDNIKIKKDLKKRSFRIIISDQNNLISLDNKILIKLENIIKKQTNYYVNRAKPDIEYWVLKRSEGVILFLERLNKHKSFDKILEKGELRSDLCYFLNYLSKPNKDDIFLDPFCGSGAITKNRLKYFGKLKLLFGIDLKENDIKELKKQFKLKNNIIFKKNDFFNNRFEDNFIDKIVTDPPWGIFDKIDDIKLFYQNILNEMYRIIKQNGLIVILTAYKEIEEIKTKYNLLEKYNILVNGKKACVYVFKKR